MQSNTREVMAEVLVRAAWLLSEYEPYGDDITGLAHMIATRTEADDWHEIRDDIVLGLAGLSRDGGEYYRGTGAGLACMGLCFGGACYWWHNGAETCWSADKPEWWDSQIEQWGPEENSVRGPLTSDEMEIED